MSGNKLPGTKLPPPPMPEVKTALSPSPLQAMKCPWCGQIHQATVCGLVKALEYHQDGSLRRVEFKTPADYPQPVINNSTNTPGWAYP